MKKRSGKAFIVLLCCLLLNSGYYNYEIGISSRMNQIQQIAKADEKENKSESNNIANNKSIEQTINSWATAFCNRDGNVLYELFNRDSKQDFLKNKYIISSKEENDIKFGFSSPWPWDTDYEYYIDGNSAEITYYAMTSEPHIYTWIEKLKIVEKDGLYYVTSEEMKEYDSVSTKEELVASISGNYSYYMNKLNYNITGLAYQLNQNAIKNKTGSYSKLFAPQTAAAYLLNLSGGNCVVKKKYISSTIVTYTFKNGIKVDIQMIQPYGTKGIWLVKDVDVEMLEKNLQSIDDWYQKNSIKKLNKIKTVIKTTELGLTDKGSTILLAAIPKEKIYLYGYDKGGAVIIRKKNKLQLFHWAYTSPMGILPKIGYADYDKDGKKEIAVSLHTGTGTGVSIDQLYLVKSCSDNTFQAMEYSRYQYITHLRERVTSKYDDTNGMLQFYVDNKKTGNAVNISAWKNEGYKFSKIGFGDQISFAMSKKGITMSFIPELCLENVASPQYDEMPTFSAKVVYKSGNFSLSDIKH